MSRVRTMLSCPVPRVRAAAAQVLAAALMLAALVLCAVRSPTAAPRLVKCAAPSLHSGSTPRLVDAAPPRLEAPLKRARVTLDLPAVASASAEPFARFTVAHAAARGLGPGRVGARDLYLSHFRRRIPRMNSEDPPCG